MYLYTGSKGILARKNNIEPMLGHPLLYMKGDEAFSKNDVLVGWGKKSNTKEGANKRGNSSRLTQSFHFFMFESIFSPVNALNQPI